MRDTNVGMNDYIERLVAIVIEKCPECLNREFVNKSPIEQPLLNKLTLKT